MKNILSIFFTISIIFLNAQNTRDVRKIFGFATSNTFTYFNINDTNFSKKVQSISPNVLRFPGGAVGNFYHFNKPAYGLNLEEIEKWHYGGFPKRAKGLLRSSKMKNHNQNYIEDFVIAANSTNASVVLVANLITGTPEETILMIEYIKQQGLDVIGVELGSELSNRPYFLAGFDKNKYIESARLFSKKIKDKYPKLKTAVVAAPIVSEKKHRHTLWNKALANYQFYDAVILHSYAKITKGRDQYGEMISEVPEGESKKEAFDLYKNRALKYFNRDYLEELKNYQKIFNKPFWITEWNLQISRTTGNTLFQGLFVANYFLHVASVNTGCQNIELTTFHNLGGRDVSGSIFMNEKEKMIIHSTYRPTCMLAKIFDTKNAEIIYYGSRTSNQMHHYTVYDTNSLINNPNSITYGQKVSRTKYECYVNWSEESEFSVIEVPATGSAIMYIYKSNNLFDQPKSDGRLIFETKEIKPEKFPPGNPISIPPYSFVVIELLYEES